jgi:hypothetical protein
MLPKEAPARATPGAGKRLDVVLCEPPQHEGGTNRIQAKAAARP